MEILAREDGVGKMPPEIPGAAAVQFDYCRAWKARDCEMVCWGIISAQEETVVKEGGVEWF